MFFIKETQAKSLIRKHKRIDSWFVSRYGFNIYRGCAHNCTYCDGRSEEYFVEGEFGKQVNVKTNAPELLAQELNPENKRKPIIRGFILPGGGVGDSYQPAEKKYKLTRKVLKVIFNAGFPVHVLTKSDLVVRDLDIIGLINKREKALVSFSLSSVDENLARVFEPGLPPPVNRLEAISQCRSKGIDTGVFLMPVIPFISDLPQHIENTVKMAKDAGAQYVVLGGMTLKEGRQKDYFYEVLRENYPDLITSYDIIYPGNKHGNAQTSYYTVLNNLFWNIARKYKMPMRIPAYTFNTAINTNDLVTIILDQMDFLLKSRGLKSPYGYAAHSVSKLEGPITTMLGKLKTIKGVGPVTEKIIHEIIYTGSSKYYEKLLIGG